MLLKKRKLNIPTLIGTLKQFPSSRRRRRRRTTRAGGAQSFSQMRTSANVNAEERERQGRWDEQEAERKRKVLKNAARAFPREQVVMRFSSNEGQTMVPDVILILIKEWRVVLVVMGSVGGIREHIVKYN